MLDFAPSFEAWPAAFAYPGLGQAAGYSMGISAAATLLAMALGLPAAWALAPRGGVPRAEPGEGRSDHAGDQPGIPRAILRQLHA